MKIRCTKLGLVFILTMTIAEIHQAGIINMYYLTSFIIALFWIGVGILGYIKNDNSNDYSIKDIKFYLKTLLFPWLVFILYNLFLYFSGNGEMKFIKSSFVQIMFTPIIIMASCSIFYIFRENLIRYLLYTFALNYIIVLVFQLINMGPDGFITGFISLFSGNSVGNPFETNSDLNFSLGLLAIYYFGNNFVITRKEKKHFICMILLILLGGKKIAYLGTAVVICMCILLKKIREATFKRLTKIISIFMIIICFVYVFLLLDGTLSLYLNNHEVNTMGRIKMYDFVAQYCHFGLDYVGKGYSFSNLILENNSYKYVLHNDILKIYVDLGIYMFSFWLIYNFFVLTKKVSKYCSGNWKLGHLVWYMTLYLFITYSTDNTLTYFLTQTIYCVILLSSTRAAKLKEIESV